MNEQLTLNNQCSNHTNIDGRRVGQNVTTAINICKHTNRNKKNEICAMNKRKRPGPISIV